MVQRGELKGTESARAADDKSVVRSRASEANRRSDVPGRDMGRIVPPGLVGFKVALAIPEA